MGQKVRRGPGLRKGQRRPRRSGQEKQMFKGHGRQIRCAPSQDKRRIKGPSRRAANPASCGGTAGRHDPLAAPTPRPGRRSPRALGEAPVLQQAVIHHQRPGHREVEGEARRDADDEAAPPAHRRGQARPFRPQHIGGVQRMPERRQVHSVLQQLDADQRAFPRQLDRRRVGEAPERHVRGVSAVSAARPARASQPAPTVKQNAAPNAWPVRSSAPCWRISKRPPPRCRNSPAWKGRVSWPNASARDRCSP